MSVTFLTPVLLCSVALQSEVDLVTRAHRSGSMFDWVHYRTKSSHPRCHNCGIGPVSICTRSPPVFGTTAVACGFGGCVWEDPSSRRALLWAADHSLNCQACLI
jgi:hypothetical protein